MVTGKEAILVDVDSLNLDLSEEGQISLIVEEKGKLKYKKQTVTLRKAAEDVIAEINRLIQESSDQDSAKGKRYFILSTNKEPFNRYNNLGLPTSKFFISKDEEKKLWLHRIVSALVEKGYLFKLDKVNGHGFYIQA